VFDVDAEHGWLAMEWTDLGALRARLQTPVDRWALPLAAALARVHESGWVHHDVKPANVLMRSDSVPLLSDFGTARRFGEPSPPGSRGYVSPERMAGRNSDPRDDIYGFGRVIEDAYLAQVAQGASQNGSRWRSIAAVCIGRDDARPRTATDLVAIISKG
jgi:serine/threonine-protein kinase